MRKILGLVASVSLALASLGAIQVTKQYCDRNAERAVSNAVQVAENYIPTIARPIVGNVVTNYLLEEGRVITNVTYEVHNIIETNSTHYIWSTNQSTFVTSVQQETNTLFEVGTDGRLRIYKGSELIWEEKE